MKKILLGIFIGFGAIAFIAFKTNNYEAKRSTSEVDQLQGCYIFVNSKPVKEYEYLGTTSNGIRLAGSSQYEPVRDRLLKKMKKDYPQADGAIFSFSNGSSDKVDAIKFKE